MTFHVGNKASEGAYWLDLLLESSRWRLVCWYSRTAIKFDNTANHNMQHGFTTGDQYSRAAVCCDLCLLFDSKPQFYIRSSWFHFSFKSLGGTCKTQPYSLFIRTV